MKTAAVEAAIKKRTREKTAMSRERERSRLPLAGDDHVVARQGRRTSRNRLFS
jgi:hypothetical protein